MARLIDADALVAGIEKLKNSGCFSGNEERILLNTILTVITMSKTIDPVKHGHWIHGSSSENIRVTCSECGYKVNYFWDSWQDAKYCPNCGARMDGDTK